MSKTLRVRTRTGWTTKPAPDLDENRLTAEEIDDTFLALDDDKANKVSGTVTDHIAGLDASGDLQSLGAQATAFNKAFGTTGGTVAEGDDSRFHDAVTAGDGITVTGQEVAADFASEAQALAGTAEDVVMSPATTFAVLQYRDFDGVFGLRWNKATSSFTRLYESEGLTGGSAFNSIEPWASMQRCNVSDAGAVNDYHGDPSFDYTGSNGQVMVEMGPFWYRTYREDGNIIFMVSAEPRMGFKIHPAFVRKGMQLPAIYPSAFEGYFLTDKMLSIANVVPSTNTATSYEGKTPITAYGAYAGTNAGDIRNCRHWAQQRGTRWEQWDFLTHNAICYLAFVEYGTFDLKTAIGKGVLSKASGDNNNAEKTGQTAGYDGGTDLGNASGQIATNGLKSMSYRGIENLYGNIWKWCDGLNIEGDHTPYVSDHDFASDVFATPYYPLNVTLPTSNEYGSDIVLNDVIDFGFLTSEVAGASNSGLYSYYYQDTGNRVARVGGSWVQGLQGGPLYWYLHSDSAYAFRFVGARALCLPAPYSR
jgi:hypothetical protein